MRLFIVSLALKRGFRDKAATPSQPFRAVKRSRLLTRLHYGPHPNRRLRILIKILTLRLCSYINLFSCQISSYGLSLSLRRLSGYGLITASGFVVSDVTLQLSFNVRWS